MPVIPTNKKLEKRHDKDNYTTPDGVAIAHLIQVRDIYNRRLGGTKVILDVGCGTGVYGWAARRIFGNDVKIVGFDIRSLNDIKTDGNPDLSRNLACYDKLMWETAEFPSGLFNIIVGNPPFNIAQKLIIDGYAQCNDEGIVSYLLRSNFLESKSRHEGLFSTHPLYQYDFLVDRIAWKNHVAGAKGKVDYETYAFFTWINTVDLFKESHKFIGRMISWKKLYKEWTENENR